MKSLMPKVVRRSRVPRFRSVVRIGMFAVMAVFFAGPAFAVVADIAPPLKRAAAVSAASKLAVLPVAPPLPADLKNPFFPAGFTDPDPAEVQKHAQDQSSATQPAGPATDAQILSAIAAWLNPSGTFLWRSDYILLVREKKLKVGDRLTITFEGRDYPVEITAIDSSSFSLRLNHTEITRPINPGKSP